MNRLMVYPGAIPLETDLLSTNKNTMIAMAKLAAAMLGTSTQVNGLGCVPTGPASLQVFVNPGEIYQLVNVDGTAYSSLAADTTHQIMKQGILLDQATLSCPAPGTGGFSINYLIEATYSDVDGGSVVLPYYNSSNPAVAYSGPANSGTPNNTIRQGLVTLTAKAGAAATTGTQTTPAADSGYVGLWVVAVANGQTQITAANIVQVVGAPIINTTLLGLAPVFTTSPIAPTPAQFDNSTKLATMAALQRALGSDAGISFINSAGTSVSPTLAGQVIVVTAIGTQNLPLGASVPLGASLHFIAAANGVVLQRSGSDLMTVGSIGLGSITLNNGDTLTLDGNGAVGWYIKGGSAALPFAPAMSGPNWTTPAQGDNSTRLATMAALQNALQKSSSVYAVDTGAANAYAISLVPAVSALTDGMIVSVRATNVNSGPSTLNVNGLGALSITGSGGALQGGEIVLGGTYVFSYNLPTTSWRLTGQAGGALQAYPGAKSNQVPVLGQFFGVMNSFGYSEFPIMVSGVIQTFIIQWGPVTASVAGTTANFAVAFPNLCFQASLTAQNGSSVVAVSGSAPSLSGFTAYCATGTAGCRYIALGY